MARRIGSNRRQMVLDGVETVEIALDVAEPARDRMCVRVGEPGQNGSASEIDDPRPPSAEPEDLVIAADGQDPISGDRDCGCAARWPHRPDGAAVEDQVGVDISHGRNVPAPRGSRR